MTRTLAMNGDAWGTIAMEKDDVGRETERLNNQVNSAFNELDRMPTNRGIDDIVEAPGNIMRQATTTRSHSTRADIFCRLQYVNSTVST